MGNGSSRVGYDVMLSRSTIYKTLSVAFLYPDDSLFHALRHGEIAGNLEDAVSRLPKPKQLSAKVKQLTRSSQGSPSTFSLHNLQQEYAGLFGHSDIVRFPLYEAEYGAKHIFEKTNELADISGFYRAFGLKLTENYRERPDHIGAELEFMHFLILKEAYARSKGWHTRAKVCLDAQRNFLRDHLGRWLPTFCKTLSKMPEAAFYRNLAEFAYSFNRWETTFLNVKPLKIGLEAPSHKSRSSSCFFDCSPGNS